MGFSAADSLILVGLLAAAAAILDALSGSSTGMLIGYSAVVSAAVIVARVVWIFPATYLTRLLSRGVRDRDPYPPWQAPTILAWAGMRGAVSAARSLQLPS